jgi:Rrf2 family iron-sulfur cluster assembly transcriptional regulator
MLSKSAIQAVKAVVALAELPRGRYAGAVSVARSTGAPENYLGKLLRLLASRGVLVSQKGKGGGFRLGRPAAELTLLDVVEPIDHVSRWSSCILGRGVCSDQNACGLHRQWGGLRQTMVGFLQGTTIAELAPAVTPKPGRKPKGGARAGRTPRR